MAVQFARAPQVSQPGVLPALSTILDHATVKDVASFGPRNNEGLWPSYNTLPIPELVPICPDPLVEAADPQPPVWATAVEFALQVRTGCHWMGLDEADQMDAVRRVFELKEHHGLNQALRNTRFVPTGSGDPIEWPVDVIELPHSGGTEAAMSEVVATLEGYASTVYAGRPTLHVPYWAIMGATASSSPFVWEGDKCFTSTGSKVVIDDRSHYQAAQEGAPALVYVTGEVYIERTPLTVVQEPMLPGMGAGGGSDEGLLDGYIFSLAERLYRVAVDGFVASLEVAV